MNNRGRLVCGIAMGATLAMVGTSSVGQQAQVFAYPSAGQTQEQQSKDRYECHQWAVSQTGFDPTTAAPLPAAPPPAYGYSDQPPPPPRGNNSTVLGIGNGGALQGSGMVGDAVTGAALGAAGGALGGDAGKGAAIGALATTLFGAVARSSSNSQSPPAQAAPPPQYQAQADAAYQDRMRRSGEYNGAFGACMKARKYTVN